MAGPWRLRRADIRDAEAPIASGSLIRGSAVAAPVFADIVGGVLGAVEPEPVPLGEERDAGEHEAEQLDESRADAGAEERRAASRACVDEALAFRSQPPSVDERGRADDVAATLEDAHQLVGRWPHRVVHDAVGPQRQQRASCRVVGGILRQAALADRSFGLHDLFNLAQEPGLILAALMNLLDGRSQAEGLGDLAIVLGALVGVLDQQADGRAGGAALEDPGEDLHLVRLAALGDDLDELLVRIVVAATSELRSDQHLAAMLASSPGEVAGELTLDGLPRIIRVATLFLVPMVEPYLPRSEANRLVELLARLVISYFLAPSDHVDLGDPESAHTFVSTFILPAFHAALTRS
mgnify:CR=1 FL=1